MTPLITDEMVEAAAKARWDYGRAETGDTTEWEMRHPAFRAFDFDSMRAALEAVAPLIAAQALRDAADEVRTYAYRSDEVTHVGTSEQGAWLIGTSDAHRAVDRLLKARADRVEEGEKL